MSARKNYPYPEDEFDVAGASGGPDGVHRADRSTASKVVPWIVVLLVVPLISFGIVFYLSQNDSDFGDGLFSDDDRPSPTEPADGDEEDGADESGGVDDDGASESGSEEREAESGAEDGEPSDEEQEAEEEEQPAPVNREAQVRVLNATRISGLAGVGAERVRADGFGSVVADNYTGGETRVNSVIKYLGDDMLPTAEQIAQVLGIDDIVEDPAASDAIIVELWGALD